MLKTRECVSTHSAGCAHCLHTWAHRHLWWECIGGRTATVTATLLTRRQGAPGGLVPPQRTSGRTAVAPREPSRSKRSLSCFPQRPVTGQQRARVNADTPPRRPPCRPGPAGLWEERSLPGPGPETHVAQKPSRCWRRRQRPVVEEAMRREKPTPPLQEVPAPTHRASGPCPLSGMLAGPHGACAAGRFCSQSPLPLPA
ncbi:hypothetical protein HJG60_008964 [Phyllostomus discolor]|uniref:Uncharacterized protein n=1 Tax=Phyllostomus discolor TaxID=89673 RepID=A0A834DIB7_9CHIR|nr:hypothetical protein HJG60_008964 [Phyllostomus discolor]